MEKKNIDNELDDDKNLNSLIEKRTITINKNNLSIISFIYVIKAIEEEIISNKLDKRYGKTVYLVYSQYNDKFYAYEDFSIKA